MFWFSMVDGEVWLDYEGIAFVNPAATARKIEFAIDWTAETNIAAPTATNPGGYTREMATGWIANGITGNTGMDFKFHINLSSIYKDVNCAEDWNKFFMKITETVSGEEVVTYVRDAATNKNGLSVAPTAGTGVGATWAAQGADITIQKMDTDKYGKNYTLKFNWGQIHFMKG